MGKAAAPASQSKFADGCIIVALVAAWSMFVVHVVGAAHREELVIADALMAFVLFGVSVLLLGATKDGDDPS